MFYLCLFVRCLKSTGRPLDLRGEDPSMFFCSSYCCMCFLIDLVSLGCLSLSVSFISWFGFVVWI